MHLPVIDHPSPERALPPPAPCGKCAFLRTCGGLRQTEILGCFEACYVDCRHDHASCDLTCPYHPAFVDRLREVGGLDRPVGSIAPIAAADLPLYVPMIRHGSRRELCLTTKNVAVSIREVFSLSRRRRGYAPVATTAEGLRDAFLIRPDARVLIVSVSSDRYLERYWEHEQALKIPAKLAGLGLVGMTVPNFSFFNEVPRLHTLWNRARMMLAAERLSAAGIGVAPHLNALVAEDWEYWTRFLREKPAIRHVTKEFQTGLRHQDKALDDIASLARLQRDVGRDLHPIIVGGSRLVRELKRDFQSVTFTDSIPFMRTSFRNRAVQRGSDIAWERVRTQRGAPLDDLLEHNIRVYDDHLKQQAFGARTS
jgi:Domain of unknown function (DUF4417)